jgi:hypothetical protein
MRRLNQEKIWQNLANFLPFFSWVIQVSIFFDENLFQPGGIQRQTLPV